MLFRSPVDHQQKMYDSLGSNCKVFISIKTGGHCYFANSSTYCSIGELTCSNSLSRADQQDVTFDMLTPYLDYYLKSSSSSMVTFSDSLLHSNRITSQKYCPVLGGQNELGANESITIYPNPANNILHISLNDNEQISQIRIWDVSSKLVLEKKNSTDNFIDISNMKSGMYFLEVTSKENSKKLKFVKH